MDHTTAPARFFMSEVKTFLHRAGYVGVGFSNRRAKMFPADVIVGWIGADDFMFVNSYTTDSHDIRASNAQPWAKSMSVGRTSSGSLVVTFTRVVKEGVSGIVSVDPAKGKTGLVVLGVFGARVRGAVWVC